MTKVATTGNELGVFPSDKFLRLLADISASNNRKKWFLPTSYCNLDDLRSKVEEAIYSTIRSTIHSAKCISPSRLTNVSLSDDDSDAFTRWFATNLIKALTPITGTIIDGKEDGVLAFLYQELSPVGIRQEIIDGHYAFAYMNGQYMVRLQTRHSPTGK